MESEKTEKTEKTEKIKQGVIPAPPPMEETDPELAEFFQKIVKHQCAAKDRGERLSRFDVERFIYEGVGRNDPCPCGSENDEGKPKKFKKCCMYQDQN